MSTRPASKSRKASQGHPDQRLPRVPPAERIVEQRFLDVIRETFELHGFSSIETRSIEPIERLSAQGEDADKEIYAVSRPRPVAADDDAALGPALRPDRAVRAVRPRERRQAGLPVPALPDPEGVARRAAPGGPLPRVHPGRHRRRRRRPALAALRGRDAARHRRRLQQVPGRRVRHPGQQPQDPRRLLPGHRASTDVIGTLRIVDKLDKIGPEKVKALLVEAGATPEQADQCLALAGDPLDRPRLRRAGARARVSSTRCSTRGSRRSRAVIRTGMAHAPGKLVADLRIARGLDYYTGTVYETQFVGHESWGSFCSGGRYDALASDGRTTYPGVGISIGVTRILGLLIGRGLVTASRSTPGRRARRPDRRRVARGRGRGGDGAASTRHRLRGRALGGQFGKQIRYAERRGIPYVWFPGAAGVAATRSRTSARVTRSPAVRRLVDPAGRGPRPAGHPRRLSPLGRSGRVRRRAVGAGPGRAARAGQGAG